MKRLHTLSKSIITMCPTPAPARYGRTADASPPAPITKQVLPSMFLGSPGQNKRSSREKKREYRDTGKHKQTDRQTDTKPTSNKIDDRHTDTRTNEIEGNRGSEQGADKTTMETCAR